MRSLKLKPVLLALILCAGAAGAVAQQKSVWISGRAIDESGAPVSGIQGTLYYDPCRNCTEHLLLGFTSQADGAFSIEADTSLKGVKLFLKYPVPSGYWTPIDAPPFSELSHLPIFSGVPVRLSKRSNHIDVGDVPVKIRYGKVNLDLTTLLGEGYRPGHAASSYLDFSVREQTGKVIYEGRFPEVAFDATYASLHLAFPPGKWFLQVALADKKKTEAKRLLIEIDKWGHAKVTEAKGL